LQKKKKVKVLAVRGRETVDQAWRRPGPERGLLIEQRSDGSHRYWGSNAGGKTTTAQMVLWGHQRWQGGAGHQPVREELGVDSIEGRSWRGLHHHLTLCFMVYAFLRLVQTRKKRAADGAGREAADQHGVELDEVSAVPAPASGAKSAAV